MKLFYSPFHTFIHKVLVTAHEAGLWDEITFVPTYPFKNREGEDQGDAYSIAALNPLNKVPTLALDSGQVRQSCNRFKPSYTIVENPAMDARVLPAGKNTGEFGAYYAHLKFYETWDNMWRFGDYPDVVVEFDSSPCAGQGDQQATSVPGVRHRMAYFGEGAHPRRAAGLPAATATAEAETGAVPTDHSRDSGG